MNASRWIPVGLTAIVMVTTLHAPAQQRIRQRPAATAPIQVKATSQKALPKAPLLNREALAQIADAAALPKNTSRTERRSIATVVGLLTKGDYDNALAEWKKAAAAYTKRTRQSDINALIQHVLREAYIEPNKDLKFYADKLKFSNEKKKIAFAYRDELRKVEKELKKNGRAGDTVRVMTPQFSETSGDPDRPVITGRVYNTVDVESVIPELQGIVVLCNRVEEESKQAGIDLQSTLKKESQTYQTLSNVMKAFHDTAKAAIQNVR